MNTPLLHLPPLDPLRGFVAAARALSFTRAAEALCLTQSAVSRQVQTLEEGLGVSLFVRGTRTLALTPEGERLARLAEDWLREYADYAASLRDTRLRPPVTVTATIGISALWLLPRLRDFQALHPDVDVRLASSNRVVDLQREGIDLALRYCPDRDVPDGAVRLFGETVFPVASPALGVSALDAATLPELTLLYFDMPGFGWLNWDDWLTADGLGQLRPRGTLHFNHYDQLIQAAVAGQGVAIGRAELVSPLLERGQLRRIGCAHREVSGRGYWLLQADAMPRDDVRRFAAWIVEAARQTRDGLATTLGAPTP